MSVAAHIPQLYAADYTRALRESLVFRARSNIEFEAQLRGYGDRVKIPNATRDPTVRDYTEATDIQAGQQMTGDEVILVMDKQKYTHLYVDDVERVQTRANVRRRLVANAAQALQKQIDTDHRTEWNTAFLAARSVQVTEAIGANNQANNLLKAITNINRLMTEADIPEDGRYWITNATAKMVLDQKFGIDGSGPYAPATGDSTVRNGFVGRLFNLDLYISNNLGNGTGTTYWRSFVAQGNGAVTNALQFQRPETLRHPERFGDNIRTLFMYGVKVVHPGRIFTVEFKKVT